MDGYAVKSADVSTLPTALRVVEEVAAGRFPARAIESGEAMRVMTGAPVPAGADSVIRREDTDDGRDRVSITNDRDVGRNIRRKGEDFHAGEVMFNAGDEITAAHAGALASAGIKSIDVHRKPRVALISSGDELVELNDFDESIAGRRIVSSNSITLSALVRHAGGEPSDLGIARDDHASLRAKMEQARDADLIITSAGISVGDHDHVRDVISEIGGSIDFWKVRMRPGAPLAFGVVHGIPWIGMSGNPVSAMVTFEIFVRPVIRRMLGYRRLFASTIRVRTGAEIRLAAPLMHFLRVIVSQNENGENVANLAGSQSSSVLTAMARANALLILPGDKLEIHEGELHRALPIGSGLFTTDRLVLT
jgi:molybdopterin molybdotransferase